MVHKEKREGKIEAIAQPGVMIGLSPNHSAYKILMLNQAGLVMVARDVQFYEDKFPYRYRLAD